MLVDLGHHLSEIVLLQSTDLLATEDNLVCLLFHRIGRWRSEQMLLTQGVPLVSLTRYLLLMGINLLDPVHRLLHLAELS